MFALHPYPGATTDSGVDSDEEDSDEEAFELCPRPRKRSRTSGFIDDEATGGDDDDDGDLEARG